MPLAKINQSNCDSSTKCCHKLNFFYIFDVLFTYVTICPPEGKSLHHKLFTFVFTRYPFHFCFGRRSKQRGIFNGNYCTKCFCLFVCKCQTCFGGRNTYVVYTDNRHHLWILFIALMRQYFTHLLPSPLLFPRSPATLFEEARHCV